MREQLHIQILEAISEIQFAYFNNPDPFHVFELALQYLLTISQSEYGFIGERLQKSDGAPYFKAYAISNTSWSEDAHDFYEKNAPEGLEFHNVHSLIGWVLGHGQSIIVNEPSNPIAAGGIN